MPRATFAGITFDLLVQGLEDRHEGLVTVREVPGSAGAGVPIAYVDVGGAQVQRRTVSVLLDDEAAYRKLAALPGTAMGTATLVTDDGEQAAVLLSVSRYLRRGADRPNLCRTEWLFLPAAPYALEPGAPGAADDLLPFSDTGWEVVELGDPADVAPVLPLEGTAWKLAGLLARLPIETTTGWALVELLGEVPLEATAWELTELTDPTP